MPSPDGKRVAYVVEGALYVHAPDGDPVLLAADDDPPIAPVALTCRSTACRNRLAWACANGVLGGGRVDGAADTVRTEIRPTPTATPTMTPIHASTPRPAAPVRCTLPRGNRIYVTTHYM